MRLAWFAPMPLPDGQHPLDPSAVVVPMLALRHPIDVFAGSRAQQDAWANWAVPVRDAYDFVWEASQRPYDLVVYQLGSDRAYDYVWGYLWNYPGLIVLQETNLHQARSRILLDGHDQRLAHYAAELRFNHGIDPAAAHSLATFTGPALHVWPMRRAVVAAARHLAIHNELLALELAQESGSPVDYIPPGAADPGLDDSATRERLREEVRKRFDLEPGTIVAAMFGPFTRARRVAETLKMLGTYREALANVRLLLLGTASDEYDPIEDARARGLLPQVRLTGAVPARELPAFLAAADVALCLRWPSLGETALEWLTCLAAGLPTVITDVAHRAHLPVLDPRTWMVEHGGQAECTPEPVAIAIDLLDEQEALRLALRRLSGDPELRMLVGRAGRRWWARHHTPEVMADAYLDTFERARMRPASAAGVPAHLRPDVFAHTRSLLGSLGTALPADLERDTRPAASP